MKSYILWSIFEVFFLGLFLFTIITIGILQSLPIGIMSIYCSNQSWGHQLTKHAEGK